MMMMMMMRDFREEEWGKTSRSKQHPIQLISDFIQEEEEEEEEALSFGDTRPRRRALLDDHHRRHNAEEEEEEECFKPREKRKETLVSHIHIAVVLQKTKA